ncbi:hypothetical protein QOZ80_6AG0548580 [Eleusine coracana subsp. coracana]|nr:hypothetical protein QOZ80_6AG0548580 [Eleusine coracana subsp. coracana]
MALESDNNSDSRARAKRRRVDEQGIQSKEGAEGVLVLRISALPVDLRQRILTHLPLKDAIRTAALAQEWRDLWKSRWAHPTSCRDIRVLPDDIPSKVLRLLMESGPRRRLDCFSLVVDNKKLRPQHLKRFLSYAAECRVEGLHVELQHCKPDSNLTFHFPLSSRRLVHLSLRGINIGSTFYKGAQPFYALEVIHLDSVRILPSTFTKLMALCPHLHTLDLRRCHCSKLLMAGSDLRSITIVECYGMVNLDAVAVPSLHSFRYIGKFLTTPFFLPEHAALTKLHICVVQPIPNIFFFCLFRDVPPV